MKNYEKLELKIKELQAEVDRLKEEEKWAKPPKGFNRSRSIRFLEEGDGGDLHFAFSWSYAPEGARHWKNIADGVSSPTVADILQIQRWVIQSYKEEYGY